MKRSLLTLFASLSIISATTAQENKGVQGTSTPPLTPTQVANVLKQLEDLEKTILAQRGNTLGAIIAKLHSAASSDAAAINFLADCDKLVNVERKDGDRKDAKRIEQNKQAEKRQPAGPDADKDGDFGTGLRLCLEYLALSLEARDVKDLSTMIPKITAFHQSMLAHGKKLKGRAGDMLMQGIGGGGGGRRGGGGLGGGVGVVIEAYQLDQFLRRPKWPSAPGDIVDMYDKVIIEAARSKKKDEMAALWDAALSSEAAFRKLRMPDGDYEVWEQNAYPTLRWQRANDLVVNGPNPVTGMADMLKVIKDFPNHANSPEWIKQLRAMVAPPEAPAEEPAK